MADMSIRVLKSTSDSVIIEVVATDLFDDPTNITWAHLSDLFDNPDGATPIAPQQASVTGERQKNRAHLVCKSISWSNNEASANGPEMAITWVGTPGSLLYAVPDDAGSHVFSFDGLTFNGGTLDATNAVLCDTPSVAPGTDEYMRVEFEFSSNDPSP
jgi:hypothetical protein